MKRVLKIVGLVVGLLVLAGLGWGLYLYTIAGEFKNLQPHFQGECTKVVGVVGAEDITIRPDGLLAYVSSDDRRATLAGRPEPGAVFAYHLGPEGGGLVNLTPEAREDFHPHGIGLHAEDGKPDRLFVVNHPRGLHRDEDTAPAHRIEIYDAVENRLVHRRTLTDELLVSPNDIVPAGSERFYVSNDHGSGSSFGRTLEDYFRIRRSNVLYFDGSSFTVVAEGFGHANGINLSPDGRHLYLAASTDRAVYAFERDPQSGSLKRMGEAFLDTGVDNIEVDTSGELWIGCHPKLLTFVSHAKDASRRSPSQVLRLTPDGRGGFARQEVFLSDGSDLSGSSVAARLGNRLLIGGVYDPLMLDCRMKGLER